MVVPSKLSPTVIVRVEGFEDLHPCWLLHDRGPVAVLLSRNRSSLTCLLEGWHCCHLPGCLHSQGDVKVCVGGKHCCLSPPVRP